jgi:hypothetical protein
MSRVSKPIVLALPRAAIGLLCVFLLVSCARTPVSTAENSDSKSSTAAAAKKSGSVRPSPTVSSRPSLSNAPEGASSSSPGNDASSAPGSAPVVVRLGSSCLEPGKQQMVTVESRPGLQVTFNTQYSDGKLGGDCGGIAVAQNIGPDGTYSNTWTLSPAAPPGPAVVTAGVASQYGERVSGFGRASFTVAKKC